MPRPVVVYDTNVTAQAVATMVAGGRSSGQVRCVELHHAGLVRLAGSAAMRDELRCVLQYPAFGFSAEDACAHTSLVYRGARDIRVRRSRRLLSRDPDDNAVLDCALEARADYLVTYNLKDYAELIPEGRARAATEFRYRGLIVLTPGRFLRRLRAAGVIS